MPLKIFLTYFGQSLLYNPLWIVYLLLFFICLFPKIFKLGFHQTRLVPWDFFFVFKTIQMPLKVFRTYFGQSLLINPLWIVYLLFLSLLFFVCLDHENIELFCQFTWKCLRDLTIGFSLIQNIVEFIFANFSVDKLLNPFWVKFSLFLIIFDRLVRAGRFHSF